VQQDVITHLSVSALMDISSGLIKHAWLVVTIDSFQPARQLLVRTVIPVVSPAQEPARPARNATMVSFWWTQPVYVQISPPSFGHLQETLSALHTWT